VKTLSPTLALNASSPVVAGEKVLDSMANPQMAIRGSSLFCALLLLQAITNSTDKMQSVIKTFFILV
jgi:hypothetical protein